MLAKNINGMIISSSFNGEIKIWNLYENFNLIQTINTGNSKVTALYVFKEYLIGGLDNKYIQIYSN